MKNTQGQKKKLEVSDSVRKAIDDNIRMQSSKHNS